MKQEENIKSEFNMNLFDPAAAGPAFPLMAVEVDAVEDGVVRELFDAINQHAEQQIEVMILDETFPLANSIVEHATLFYFRESVDELRTLFD
ncbi:enhanced serine sensitivity protein SseB C-terminal domain-containing protein [Bacillus sp. REN3]|uniref:enhanced serine sensitivity protein SseB C-terminal domain-containing protein n=1 Tax=Bacillus sp. REN3 TaxID=2802440 RepID=UPI001AED57FC|nr:enhanced serine sensitivity protein SseB C-terminal domain-containing protein [Bacillus sp. REN3]